MNDLVPVDSIEISGITETDVNCQNQWLHDLGKKLRNWTDVENMSIMKQAEILWDVWSLWEADRNVERVFLSSAAKADWAGDFYKWAKMYTRTRGKEPAEITIDNKISVYRDWHAEPIIECPEYVYIPNRKENGKLVDDTFESKEAWVKVEFDPTQCDYGKKLVARATAKKGQMTPESWTAMADPYATVSDLKSAIKENGIIDDTGDFEIYERDGLIWGKQDDHYVPVLQVLFENQDDTLFYKTLERVLKALGMKVPLHYQDVLSVLSSD